MRISRSEAIKKRKARRNWLLIGSSGPSVWRTISHQGLLHSGRIELRNRFKSIGRLAPCGMTHPRRSSYAEPRRHPDVFDREKQPQQNLDRQRQHENKKRVHGDQLHQAHALVDLSAELGAHADPVDQKRRDNEEGDQREYPEENARPESAP